MERYRKQGGKLKCKECVQKTEDDERQKAAEKRAATLSLNKEKSIEEPTDKRTCASCLRLLDQNEFNRNQWSKGEGKSRCRPCVEMAVSEEAKQLEDSKKEKLDAARERVYKAKSAGNTPAVLKAESELAALEAEIVTGLKPIKMGRGGGRGRGRGPGRGQSNRTEGSKGGRGR